MARYLAGGCLALLFVALFAGHASAANPLDRYIRIESRALPGGEINIQSGLAVGPAEAGWWSADWVVERIGSEPYFRLRNRWTGAYLHNQSGKLEVGPADPGWWSAQWAAGFWQDSVTLQNRWTGEWLKLGAGNTVTLASAAGFDSDSEPYIWKLKAPDSTSQVELINPNPLLFPQCINNAFGSGIIMTVEWYHPSQVKPITISAKQEFHWEGKPWRTETKPVFQQSCVADRVRMFAVARIVGASELSIVATAAAQIGAGIGIGAACLGTVGFACVGAGVVAGSIVAATTFKKPEEIFYMGVPVQVDVTGTGFNVSAEEKGKWP